MTIPPNGIRYPGWLIACVVATLTIASTGWAIGRAVQSRDNRMDLLEVQQRTMASEQQRKVDLADLQAFNLRLCRIERALRIEPWETCR